MTIRHRRVLKPETQMRQVARWQERWVWRGVGFSDDQAAVLRDITERYRLSLGEVLDRVFARYVPATYGVTWPLAKRDKRRWRLHQYKVKLPGRNVRVYGFLLDQRQVSVLAALIAKVSAPGDEVGVWPAMVEESFGEYIPKLFGKAWPEHPRRRILSHREPDDHLIAAGE